MLIGLICLIFKHINSTKINKYNTMKLDKNTLAHFAEQKAEKIKVFFYDAWCSGMKVDIVDEFEVDESVELSDTLDWLKIYIDKRDKEKLENCMITRVVIADHTGKEKVRYIYKWEEVKWRCWCWSSFNFGEEKKPKLDLSKLRSFKSNFKK